MVKPMNYKQIIIICFVLIFASLAVASEEAVESSNETSQNVHFEKIEINEEEKLNLQRFESIIKYDIVTVHPVAFKKDADSGEIVIELSGKEFKLQLEPGIYINEGDQQFLHNETGLYEIEMGEIYTYNGKVVGYPQSEVHFTVSNTVVLGTVEINDIKYRIGRAGKIERNGEKIVVDIIYRNGDVESSETLPSGDDLVYD